MFAIDDHFVMEMGAGASSRRAKIADNVAFLDFGSDRRAYFAHMGIMRSQTVRMGDEHVVAMGGASIGLDYGAVGSRVDRIPRVSAYVQTCVRGSSIRKRVLAYAEGRRYPP